MSTFPRLVMGMTDKGSMPDFTQFFTTYHMGQVKKQALRGEANNEWYALTELPAEHSKVKYLQETLRSFGFDPLKTDPEGVFGYGTRAAVRLFQEYVRSMEGQEVTPQGVVGEKTWPQIERWANNPNRVNEWASGYQSAEYEKWKNILTAMKDHYLKSEKAKPFIERLSNYKNDTATLQPEDWHTEENAVHLIGIRRAVTASKMNNDLFVLLINGMVFSFWGSTNPNPEQARADGFPFLLEGQHRYSFGWHKIADQKKIYPALKPSVANGVLIVRLKAGDKNVNDADIFEGKWERNASINIHWSGDGDYNFSAGCQVIAGRSYANHRGDLIPCHTYASDNYSSLGAAKTRGAYNVLADLVLTLAPANTKHVYYSLISEERLEQFTPLNTEELFAQLKNATEGNISALA